MSSLFQTLQKHQICPKSCAGSKNGKNAIWQKNWLLSVIVEKISSCTSPKRPSSLTHATQTTNKFHKRQNEFFCANFITKHFACIMRKSKTTKNISFPDVISHTAPNYVRNGRVNHHLRQYSENQLR